MLAEFKVGQQVAGESSQVTGRADRTGSLVVTNGHADMAETTVRGNLMTASTAVGGVAPGTALSTTPPMFVWNPPASGKNLIINKINVGYVSGTLGAGSIVIATVTAQATVPTTGAELVPQNNLVGFPRGVGRAFQGSTVASTPALLTPLMNMGAFTTTTAIAPQDAEKLLNGSVVVTPGSGVAFQGVAAAGTSPLVMIGVQWEEIAV